MNVANNYNKNVPRPFKTNYQTSGYSDANNNIGGNNNYTRNLLYIGSNNNKNIVICDFCKKNKAY